MNLPRWVWTLDRWCQRALEMAAVAVCAALVAAFFTMGE